MKKIYICPNVDVVQLHMTCTLLDGSNSEGINKSEADYIDGNVSDATLVDQGGFGTKDRGADLGNDTWGNLW